MAYRFNGVECDTFEELQRLQGSARTTSAVVKETHEQGERKQCKEYVLGQTGPGMGYERCGKWAGHKGECEA